MRRILGVLLSSVLISQWTTQAAADQQVVTFSDDGGWCWFEDERAIVCDGSLLIGTVADGRHNPGRRGNIEVISHNLASGKTVCRVLHEGLQRDDHNSPALLVRGDGRILAMYSRHSSENKVYYRISQNPGDSTSWQEERVFIPDAGAQVTYTNLFRLSAENGGKGRIYNFYRGYDHSRRPSWMTSDDDGRTWTAHDLWIERPTEKELLGPYVKYASNDRDTIHFVFTDGHPLFHNNSIYHSYYRDGAIYRSDESTIKKVGEGPIVPTEATRVFRGDADNVAWTSDLHLDERGQPVTVYSVKKDSAGLKPGHPDNGKDHRYRYARWGGKRWHDHEIAYAGTRLYRGQDDYTGTICIDPDSPNVVYLSSDVNICTGRPNANGHYQIYRGVTNDFGKTWRFVAVTSNSKVDNIRPIVPRWNKQNTALLWLRGTYYDYTNYDLEVVGTIVKSGAQ